MEKKNVVGCENFEGVEGVTVFKGEEKPARIDKKKDQFFCFCFLFFLNLLQIANK